MDEFDIFKLFFKSTKDFIQTSKHEDTPEDIEKLR